VPAVSDADRVRDAILGALPGVKPGTLRIWGDWFGRPHDNVHRVVGASADGECVTVDFDAGEQLMVWRPDGYEIDGSHFRIDGAYRFRWEWVPYGRAAGARAFLDYLRQGSVIRGETNVTWFTPSFLTDPAMPAAELV
jgi:hypothetical protein